MGRGLEGEGGARSNEAQSGGAENETAKQRVNYASSVWIGMKAMNKENNVYAGEYWENFGSYSFSPQKISHIFGCLHYGGGGDVCR